MTEQKERRSGKPAEKKPKREKLSLYPLTIEEALRAAAKTGRPPKPGPRAQQGDEGNKDAKPRKTDGPNRGEGHD